jgi:hypothetical protein
LHRACCFASRLLFCISLAVLHLACCFASHLLFCRRCAGGSAEEST